MTKGPMFPSPHVFRRLAARHRFSRPIRAFPKPIFGAPFPPRARVRIVVYHHADPISWSQVYPFFHDARTFERRYGAHIRSFPVADFLARRPAPEADVVLVQPWLTEPPERMEAAFAQYRATFPDTRIIFLDAYAQCDLRFGRVVEPYVDLYQRKALFRDRSLFLHPFAGDTNLTEYYSGLYDIPAAPVDWQVPERLLDRLSLVPNFLTAAYLMDGFLGPEPEFTDRPIDLHSRVATKGTPWYAAMRSTANAAAKAIEGIRLTPEGRIPRGQFLDEMRHARLCWSPFGYGELCWRDLEAFMTGAVLVKPDMGHLETLPDLYVPGKTYLPVKWDFSDLEAVVRGALADPEAQRRIALNAFHVARDYLREQRFVADMAGDLALAG